MDENTLDAILSANPWLGDSRLFPEAARHRIPSPFIDRAVPQVDSWPVRGKAHLIVGARQVGKSSLVWHWFAKKNLAPLYLNADELLIRSWCRSTSMVLKDIGELSNPNMPVFIDEAQHIEEAGLFVKGLVDGGIPNPLFVTGSSWFHLMSRTRESLAGRSVRTLLHPFGLGEVTAGLTGLAPLVRRKKTGEAAYRQMVVGGYPEVWQAENPRQVLAHLLEAFIVRDASDLFRIQHLDAFRRLLLLIAGQVGSLINTSEWSSICGVARGTIADYLDLLGQVQVIHMVHPFVGGKRSEVIRRPKIYFCDNGIWNMVSRKLVPFAERTDRGPCLENWVAGELRKLLPPLLPMGELRFWRSKSGAEVDFVIERPDGLIALEVKSTKMTRPEISRSARSFIQAYAPRRFVVVNLGLDHERRMGATNITWLRPDAFADPGTVSGF